MTRALRWGGRPALVVAAVLAGYAAVRSLWIPSALDPLVNAIVGFGLLVAAPRAGFSDAEVGVERSSVRVGLRLGLLAWLPIAVALVLAALLPATRGALRDDRADVTLAAMVVQVFVVIPLGTALLEEVAFRGLLLAAFRRGGSVARAALCSSVLFGLWHVAPTLATARGNDAVRDASTAGIVALVAGMVVAMTGAGLVFCWLRIRSRSLVAPFVLHAGVNGTAFALAWAVVRH